MHKIVSQTGIDTLWVMLRLQLLVIHADELFAAPRVLAKTVVSNSVKPCGKARFAAKAPDVFVRTNEGFLCEVISQGNISARELSKQTAHGGLMPPHELAESVLIVIRKDSCDKVRISQLHVAILRYRRGRWNVPLSFQLPDEQVTNADQEWNNAQCPGGATPIGCSKKNPYTESDHC